MLEAIRLDKVYVVLVGSCRNTALKNVQFDPTSIAPKHKRGTAVAILPSQGIIIQPFSNDPSPRLIMLA
jgi:hypothetical protein